MNTRSAYYSETLKSWVRMEREADGEYCHTSGFQNFEEAMGTLKTNKRRIIATFHPQAWINDYACAVDPDGETTWDVTEEIEAMGKTQALKLQDDQYATDALRFSKNAPKWVREWSGPFYVEVENEIWAFYENNNDEKED